MNTLYQLIKITGFCLCLLTTATFVNAHTDEAPWETCEGQASAAPCSFTNAQGDLYKGACQLITDTLMCVRNEPVVPAEERVDNKLMPLETNHQESHSH